MAQTRPEGNKFYANNNMNVFKRYQLSLKIYLIKAAPGSTLDQTNEDPAHRLHINALITIEY